MTLLSKVKILCFLVVAIVGCMKPKSTSETKSDVGLHYSPRGQQDIKLYLFKVPNLPLICSGLCSIDPASIADSVKRRQACSKENFGVSLPDFTSMPVPVEYSSLMKNIVDELTNEKDLGFKSFIANRKFDPLVKLLAKQIREKGQRDFCTKWINSQVDVPKPANAHKATGKAQKTTGKSPAVSPTINASCKTVNDIQYCLGHTIYNIHGAFGPILGFFPNGEISWRNDGNHSRTVTSAAHDLGVRYGCIKSESFSYCVGDAVVHREGGYGKIVAVFSSGRVGWINEGYRDRFELESVTLLARSPR